MTSYSELILPTGKFDVPTWCKDAHVNWDERYSNAPQIKLKTDGPIHQWDGQQWDMIDGRWFSTHPDGRGRSWTHKGQMIDRGDQVEAQQQGGMGGMAIQITMADDASVWPGRNVVLYGPWNSGPMTGYNEVTTIQQSHHSDLQAKWYRQGGGAGADISTNLLLRIVARYLPHLQVFQDCDQYVPVQVAKPEWGMPKEQWMKRSVAKCS